MNSSLVTINLVVRNGERYIRHCLDSILKQSYPSTQIDINIFDNESTDQTREIARSYEQQFTEKGFHSFLIVESPENLGTWRGQEKLFRTATKGEYVLLLSVDIVLDEKFLEEGVAYLARDEQAGAVEAKIYRFNIDEPVFMRSTIDTCGFELWKSRRISNIGHGEEDQGQYSSVREILAVEGAAPLMRRSAMADTIVGDELTDHDFFWYSEDLDFAWRMRLFGWRHYFVPTMVAWHDRQTTKRRRSTPFDFVRIRRLIPLQKRRLDWRNTHFTFIKNEYIINILRDLPWILTREIFLFGYLLVFETAVLTEIWAMIRWLPRMLRKRRLIMSRAVASPSEIHSFFR